MEPRKPSLALAVLIFLAVAVLIIFSVMVWEVDIHISLILGAILAGISEFSISNMIMLRSKRGSSTAL